MSNFSLMHPEQNLETLMCQYQQGNFAAASTLIRQLSPRLLNFFLAQFASRADADDLLQETWLRIHDVRQTYRPGEPVMPWLYAIARHVRIDHYRRMRRRSGREEQLQDGHQPAAPEQRTDVEAMLAILPESQREVIEMLKVTGMSLEEVARATSSSVGSVKQKAHRAYNKMREYLGKEARHD